VGEGEGEGGAPTWGRGTGSSLPLAYVTRHPRSFCFTNKHLIHYCSNWSNPYLFFTYAPLPASPPYSVFELEVLDLPVTRDSLAPRAGAAGAGGRADKQEEQDDLHATIYMCREDASKR
jgi:hypothetical protein